MAGGDLRALVPAGSDQHQRDAHGCRWKPVTASIQTPHIDWLTLSPELSLLAAAAICLLVAVLTPATWRRGLGAFFALAGFVTAGIFAGVVFHRSVTPSLEVGNAIVRDRLGVYGAFIVCGSGILAVFTSYAH